MFDLHVHTTGSDGDLDAKGIINEAKNNSIKYIAITDHDTVSNVDKCANEGKKYGIRVISGVEISVDYHGGTMHMLGYGVDTKNKEFIDVLKKTRDSVIERNEKIVQILNKNGIDITMDEIVACGDGTNVRRPHIALAMQKKGYVKDVQEAFEKYLSSDEIANIKRFKLKDKDAIELINKAGGIAVLAHPFTLKLSDEKLKSKIEELSKYGLSGVEAFHSKHIEEQMMFYKKIADENGLISTCGSDYHGTTVKPNIMLGTGINNNIPTDNYEIINNLLSRIKSQHKIKYKELDENER